MSNVEWYYKTVRKYRDGLERINGKYDQQIESKKAMPVLRVMRQTSRRSRESG